MLHQQEEKTGQQADMSVLECPQAPVKGRCWPPAHSFLGMVLQRL